MNFLVLKDIFKIGYRLHLFSCGGVFHVFGSYTLLFFKNNSRLPASTSGNELSESQ